MTNVNKRDSFALPQEYLMPLASVCLFFAGIGSVPALCEEEQSKNKLSPQEVAKPASGKDSPAGKVEVKPEVKAAEKLAPPTPSASPQPAGAPVVPEKPGEVKEQPAAAPVVPEKPGEIKEQPAAAPVIPVKPGESKDAKENISADKPVMAEPIPTAAPTPKPTPLPAVESSPFLKLGAAQSLTDAKKTPSTLKQEAKSNLVEAGRDEQMVLLKPSAGALAGGSLLYQRRYNPADPFTVRFRYIDSGEEYEPLKWAHVKESVSYCAGTEEILFLGPSVDGSGKVGNLARPSRLYIFNIRTGLKQLVWVKPPGLKGFIKSNITATPDCMHLLLSLELQTEGNKIPYGQLVYLRRPQMEGRDWTAGVVAESQKNGVTKGFSEAIFMQPEDHRYYTTSENPPRIAALTTYVGNPPTLTIFSAPKGRPDAAQVRWSRVRPSLPSEVVEPKFLATYNKSSHLLFAYDTAEGSPSGLAQQGVGILDVEKSEDGFVKIASSAEFYLTSLSVHPKGNRIALTYVKPKQVTDVYSLPNRLLGGVMELYTKDKVLQYHVVDEMIPFHALSKHHYPNAAYTSDGKFLLYGRPEISDSVGPELYQPKRNTLPTLDFPIKITQWLLE